MGTLSHAALRPCASQGRKDKPGEGYSDGAKVQVDGGGGAAQEPKPCAQVPACYHIVRGPPVTVHGAFPRRPLVHNICSRREGSRHKEQGICKGHERVRGALFRRAICPARACSRHVEEEGRNSRPWHDGSSVPVRVC